MRHNWAGTFPDVDLPEVNSNNLGLLDAAIRKQGPVSCITSFLELSNRPRQAGQLLGLPPRLSQLHMGRVAGGHRRDALIKTFAAGHKDCGRRAQRAGAASSACRRGRNARGGSHGAHSFTSACHDSADGSRAQSLAGWASDLWQDPPASSPPHHLPAVEAREGAQHVGDLPRHQLSVDHAGRGTLLPPGCKHNLVHSVHVCNDLMVPVALSGRVARNPHRSQSQLASPCDWPRGSHGRGRHARACTGQDMKDMHDCLMRIDRPFPARLRT